MSKITFGGTNVGGGGGANITGLSEASGNLLLPRNEFAASGNTGGIPLSGTIVGAGTQFSLSGLPLGNYLLPDISGIGSVIVSGQTWYPANLTIYGSGSVVVTSGGPASIIISGGGGGGDVSAASGNALLPRNEFASSGNKGGIPFSGTSFGASAQIYVSGLPFGDYLQPDMSGVGSVIVSGATIYPTNLSVYGSGGVTVSTGGSSAIVISGILPVDARASTATIYPTNSGTLDLGQAARPWKDVYSSGIVIYDANGVKWRITVSTLGVLTTTAI